MRRLFCWVNNSHVFSITSLNVILTFLHTSFSQVSYFEAVVTEFRVLNYLHSILKRLLFELFIVLELMYCITHQAFYTHISAYRRRLAILTHSIWYRGTRPSKVSMSCTSCAHCARRARLIVGPILLACVLVTIERTTKDRIVSSLSPISKEPLNLMNSRMLSRPLNAVGNL